MKISDRYAQSLTLALHARRVPSARIGEIVAEVDSHVAETGEDPHEAFGEPHEYARAVAPHRPRRAWWIAAEALIGAVTGYAVIDAVVALLQGRSFLGLPPVAAVPVAVVLFILAAWFVQRRRPSVHDPRTGARLSTGGGTAFVVVVGTVTVLAAVAMVVATR